VTVLSLLHEAIFWKIFPDSTRLEHLTPEGHVAASLRDSGPLHEERVELLVLLASGGE